MVHLVVHGHVGGGRGGWGIILLLVFCSGRSDCVFVLYRWSSKASFSRADNATLCFGLLYVEDTAMIVHSSMRMFKNPLYIDHACTTFLVVLSLD